MFDSFMESLKISRVNLWFNYHNIGYFWLGGWVSNREGTWRELPLINKTLIFDMDDNWKDVLWKIIVSLLWLVHLSLHRLQFNKYIYLKVYIYSCLPPPHPGSDNTEPYIHYAYFYVDTENGVVVTRGEGDREDKMREGHQLYGEGWKAEFWWWA